MGFTRSGYLPGTLIATTRLGIKRFNEIPRAVIRQAVGRRHVVNTIDAFDRQRQQFIRARQARLARERQREQQDSNPPAPSREARVEEVD